MLTDLWMRVREEIHKYDLLVHPFYRAWTARELTRKEIGFYAAQYLHHVAAFPTYLTALHCRLPDGEVRRAILWNAADEEVHGVSHADLWKQFVCEMNPVAASGAHQILPEMHQLVKTYRDIAEHAPLSTALGAFYAYASQVPQIAEEKRAGLKSFYAASDAACEYFTLHTTAELHHANVWRTLIDHCIHEDHTSAEKALRGVNRGAKALWRALDGIEAARRRLDKESRPQP